MSESWIRGALVFGFVLKLPLIMFSNISSADCERLSGDKFGFVSYLTSNFVSRICFKIIFI